jgi:hypothetical protein
VRSLRIVTQDSTEPVANNPDLGSAKTSEWLLHKGPFMKLEHRRGLRSFQISTAKASFETRKAGGSTVQGGYLRKLFARCLGEGRVSPAVTSFRAVPFLAIITDVTYE